MDCANKNIKKEISFGVNDSQADRLKAKQDFKNGNYYTLKQITFQHNDFEIDFDGVVINQNTVKVSYDRTGNILIGMDIMSKLDIHISKSKVLNKTVLIACPLDKLNNDYYKALNDHFDLDNNLLNASVFQAET